VWTFGEIVMETAALNAVAGRPKEEYGMEPQSLDEVRPGCYDVHERVKDMDAGGVLASMNYDPFAHVPRDQATVGALRRRAAGHDVSVVSSGARGRTPDEKLEGFRRRARRAVAAAGR
jgi:hypothetical protein